MTTSEKLAAQRESEFVLWWNNYCFWKSSGHTQSHGTNCGPYPFREPTCELLKETARVAWWAALNISSS